MVVTGIAKNFEGAFNLFNIKLTKAERDIEICKQLGLLEDKCYFCNNECKQAGVVYCELMEVKRVVL
jgi:hypothetical protein